MLPDSLGIATVFDSDPARRYLESALKEIQPSVVLLPRSADCYNGPDSLVEEVDKEVLQAEAELELSAWSGDCGGGMFDAVSSTEGGCMLSGVVLL